MTNATTESTQYSYLDIRAALIHQDVRYLQEKIDRLEHLIERLTDKHSANHLSLLEKINAVECRVIRSS